MSGVPRRLIPWFLAFAAVALAAAWRPWAGLGLAAALAALAWRSEAAAADGLARYLARIEVGDFDASRPEARWGAPPSAGSAGAAMAAALKARFAAAEGLRRRLMAALDGMDEGVALCDADGALLLINPAFRRLAGYEGPVPRGRFLWEAVRDPQLNDAVEQALKRGRSAAVDLPLEQGRIEGRALVAPIEGPGGVVVFLLDRTEERKAERMRSEFVANVSHELRTPLAAIKAALETLRDGALEDARVNRDFLGKAIHHTERLEELLSDLLALSRIEDQRRRGLGPSDPACSVAEAWAEAEGALEASVRRVQGSLRSEFPSDLPRVRMERAALRQILVNYCENALKYSGPEPSVLVGASREGAAVEVWVRDDGPGIPEADLPRVFERFFRVERARTRGPGGSGLGLSIVKHLAEGAGAQVGAENLVRGCRFWVRLKVREEPAASPGRAPDFRIP